MHLLSIEETSAQQLELLIDLAVDLKATRGDHRSQPLAGQTWAIIFTKASTRTRVSFEVGIRELGGRVMFLSKDDIQLGRGEPIKDTARVLGRMVHGAVIRTFSQQDVVDFAHFSGIPTINALTDDEHPCQILADLLTIREKLGGWSGKKIVFIGDGDNNMSRSWMWAAKYLGFELVVAAPKECLPPSEFLIRLNAANVSLTSDPVEAVKGAHVVNTDVWLSMGQEGQMEKEALFGDFQVNKELLSHCAEGHIVLHCLPAYREKEITEEVLELHSDTIFQQAENRLHAQKAVLARVDPYDLLRS
ncbi:ornithine carbamoyltransferase [Akkermansiaceae bacterium]|jgi:ornithine carbamoyltransferase|nr:ornithine carbamoyltransferase [Akkermansiaceae bacterium]MDB4399998.1 ornithine carbamoyltransferase [Akkermansiaceae bacterium]MDB4519189.1 ornithine carbamoyltransferase [Akkermansiaceae bacterium]|tara:strand:- start:386 stop:1297 length:912 start_codon:yes stop_codon:yes gene_type:complete